MPRTRQDKLRGTIKWGTSKKYQQEEIRNAKKWFRDQVQSLKGDKVKRKMSDFRTRTALPDTLMGSMLFYKYDPKHKLTLPYYDTFPLIILIGEYDDGWLGLNLHYLPPGMRATFLTRLMDTLNNTKFNKTTRFQATYHILTKAQKYRYFKPCIKRYLNNHVQSKVQLIRPSKWHHAIFLPTARFKKASDKTVWTDSKRIMMQ